jgi:o-succinylbenzoate---CoA ligase
MPELVPDWLASWAEDDPAAPALAAASGVWTAAALDREVNALGSRLASALQAAGIAGRPQDAVSRQLGRLAVAALLEDDAQAVLLIHALRRLGLVHLPLDRRAAVGELEEQLWAAGAAILATDAPNETRAREIAAAGGLAPSSVVPIDVPLPPTPADRGPVPRVDLDAVATVVFTSGTTGRPRGAVLTHGNHVASADAWAQVLIPRPSDCWLACLPLFHVAGLAIVTRAARWRASLEVMRRFDADAVAIRIADGISHLSLVPTQLDRLLEAWAGRPVPTTLRALLLGGAPVPGPTLAAARAIGLPVLTTYGMTETASGVAVGGAERATVADPDAFRPLPGVAVRIDAPGPDGIGSVALRGGMIFAGYLGDRGGPDGPRARGWLRTRDLGSLDEAGLLRIADRRDDLIISGGENVYPAEVERVLGEHPAVVEVAVVGLPDPAWGARPVAFVVLAPGTALPDEELARHCRERLAGFKVPTAFHRRTSLPRNDAGKVLRRELRDGLVQGQP